MRSSARLTPWLAALAVLPFVGCSSCEKPVRFAPRSPEAADVARALARDEEKLGDYRPEGQALRVVEHFQKANLMVASRNKPPPAELVQELFILRMAAKQLLIEDGQQAATRLGLYLLARFETHLEELSSAARDVPGAAAALLTGSEPPAGIRDTFEKFARFGGTFLVLAAANDLVRQDDDGGIELSEHNRFFVRLAFKVYWANVMPDATGAIDWVLPDYERRWYEIWVAERSLTAPLARKLAAIGYLEAHEPHYRAHAARGIVLFLSHKYPKSVQSFELALKEHPGDKNLKRFLAEAKKRNR